MTERHNITHASKDTYITSCLLGVYNDIVIIATDTHVEYTQIYDI